MHEEHGFVTSPVLWKQTPVTDAVPLTAFMFREALLLSFSCAISSIPSQFSSRQDVPTCFFVKLTYPLYSEKTAQTPRTRSPVNRTKLTDGLDEPRIHVWLPLAVMNTYNWDRLCFLRGMNSGRIKRWRSKHENQARSTGNLLVYDISTFTKYRLL